MKEYKGYKVLEDGTVLNRDGSIKRWSENQKGYLISAISEEGKRIAISHHRMVAAAFYGKCPKKHEVNHKDNDRKNNHPSNLEYVTKSKNNQQSWDSGNRCATGINNANCKVSEKDVHMVCKQIENDFKLNVSELSRKTGISRTTITKIKLKEQWSHISKHYNF
tara:strand:- start:52686 stop:53177 length:492 start_codon:yes stop_codon:yes gene_type:complete